MIRRLPLLLSGAALFSGLWACDSLSDPSKDGTPDGPTARISGALSGSVPEHTRVAVVWATEAGLARGADAPVVNGQFTIDLGTVPAGALLDASDSDDHTPPSGSSASPDSTTSGPTNATGGGDGGISTQTVASGTTISTPMRIGQAGFIVYVDTNGNSQLDFDDQATSTDTIIGANRDFILTYLQGGSTVDYEKLRDRANNPPLSLPHEGFNLRWEGGDDYRWWALDQVQLEVTQSSLPGIVCQSFYDYGNLDGIAMVDAGTHPVCYSDGTPYDTENCTSAPPNNLCAASFGTSCTRSGGGSTAPGLPCSDGADGGTGPITTFVDGGVNGDTQADGGVIVGIDSGVQE